MITITQDERNNLITQNIRLATGAFWKYYPMIKDYMEVDDGLSICYIGLIKAIDSYDSSKGGTLSTYAYQVIKNELLQNLRILKRIPLCISLDTSILSEDNECTLEYFLKDYFDLEEYVDNIITNEILANAINSLNDMDKRLILLHLQGLTQRQIADILNISQPYVARTLKKIVNKLRDTFKKGGLM